MKSVQLCLLLIYMICRGDAEDTTYTTKYDGINLDEILSSDRLLNGYINCLLEVGPCTPDGKELKSNLPDAIGDDCGKCTKRQRDGADEVMHYIIEHRPDDWAKLEEKYNSDGSYKKKYMDTKEKKTAKVTEEKSQDEDNEEGSKEKAE